MPSNESSAATPHENALMKLYDIAVGQRSEIGMHFHELAMRDPFKAEGEYQALCDDVRRIVIEAGVTRGHKWRPYEPAAS
jgi:hypothetical protein